MIFIKKNDTSRITDDIDQYENYLLEFSNTATCSSVIAVFANTSFDCAYPVFSITEVCSGDENVLLGEINLDYIGYWSVNIYGNPDNVNLDPNLATFIKQEEVKVYIEGCDTCKSC